MPKLGGLSLLETKQNQGSPPFSSPFWLTLLAHPSSPQRTWISEVGYLQPSPLTCWDSSLSPAKQIFAQSFPNFDVSGYFFNKGGNISCNFQKNLCRNASLLAAEIKLTTESVET